MKTSDQFDFHYAGHKEQKDVEEAITDKLCVLNNSTV